MPNPRLQTGLKHDVNGYPKQILEFILQRDEGEQAGRFGKGHQHVEITAVVLFVANIRAKDAERGDVIALSERALMLSQESDVLCDRPISREGIRGHLNLIGGFKKAIPQV